MTIKAIKRILDVHSIPYFVRDGEIYADTMECGTELFEQVENVTTWTKKQLFIWLGY